jgi:uncharacterized membrane protein
VRSVLKPVIAGPIVAAVTLSGALIGTHQAGVPFRDPDHVVGKRLTYVALLVLALVGLDIAVRAGHRARTWRPSLAAMRAVRRERWHRERGWAVASAIVSFYITYLAYRNLKSIVPLLRPGELFDTRLAEWDRSLLGGNDAAELLHDLLGTGAATHVLSLFYGFFILFVPLSLALALVFSRHLFGGVFYATALGINWPLGALSYLLLPAMGPAYAAPAEFTALPETHVLHVQHLMLQQRLDFIHHPLAHDAAQNIAAFASLHISMTLTAALAAHIVGLSRRWRIGLWSLFAITVVATIHLGWHYVIDDLAALPMAVTALALARVLTGFAPSAADSRVPAPVPVGAD